MVTAAMCLTKFFLCATRAKYPLRPVCVYVCVWSVKSIIGYICMDI